MGASMKSLLICLGIFLFTDCSAQVQNWQFLELFMAVYKTVKIMYTIGSFMNYLWVCLKLENMIKGFPDIQISGR